MNKKYKGGVRLLQGSNSKCLCILCNNQLSLDNGIILNCGCCWHITCFIQYIVESFKDKKHYFTNKGVRCIAREHWKNIDNSISLIEVNELIDLIRGKNIKKMLLDDNMVNINYNKFLVNKNNKFKLFTENNKIIENERENWERLLNNNSKEEDSKSFINTIVKRCPCGKGGGIHYHGHGCHAIDCESCKIEFCYTCGGVNQYELSIHKDNKAYHKCKCNKSGFLHHFCNTHNIKRNLINNDVLRDKRCNCPICPDCRKGKPCEACPKGDCVVCLGIVQPGRIESKVKYNKLQQLFNPKKFEENNTFIRLTAKESTWNNNWNNRHSYLNRTVVERNEIPVKINKIPITVQSSNTHIGENENEYENEYENNNIENNNIENTYFENNSNNEKYKFTSRRTRF